MRALDAWVIIPANDGGVGRAGVKPHIQGVCTFFIKLGIIAKQFSRIETLPYLYAVLLNKISDPLHKRRSVRVECTSLFVYKKGHGQTPLPLRSEEQTS